MEPILAVLCKYILCNIIPESGTQTIYMAYAWAVITIKN